MQLIAILLITVSILAVLSGFAILLGSSRGSRSRALTFFLTTLGVFGWSLSIAVYLILDKNASGVATIVIYGIYLSTLVMDLFVLIYVGWRIKWSRIPIAISAIASILLAGLLIYNPNFLFDSFSLSTDGNSVAVRLDWYYISYILLMLFEGISVTLLIFHRIKHTTNPGTKRGWKIFLISLSIGWIIAGIFDLYLPLYRYDLIWVGPLFIAIDFVVHYYVIIRYRLLELASSWLKVLSHIIVMSFAAVIFLTIFFIVFTAIFKVPSPSSAVIILNIIMVSIVMILFPVLNEISSYFRSLSSIEEIDLVYFVRKIQQISKSYIDYRELANLLSIHLHFQYIGLIIDKKLYSSKPSKLSTAEVAYISNYRTPAKGIWLALSDSEKNEFRHLGIEAIAVLRDGNGEIAGKIIFGRPMGNTTFANRSLQPIETALTMTASAISQEKGPKN